MASIAPPTKTYKKKKQKSIVRTIFLDASPYNCYKLGLSDLPNLINLDCFKRITHYSFTKIK